MKQTKVKLNPQGEVDITIPEIVEMTVAEISKDLGKLLK